MSASFITKFAVPVLITAAAAWGQTWTSGEATVTLSGGTLTVSGNGAMKDYGYQFPDTTPWYGVRTSITGLVIENGVTHIGNRAFAGCFIKSATIPSGVTSIGERAFYHCSRLTSVDIMDGAVSIGEMAFENTGLASITIPGSVSSIGDGAFGGQNSWNKKLTSINVAADNAHYSSEDGILFNKDKTALLRYPPAKRGAYNIPSGVTSVGRYAFSGCNLTSVTIPDGVTSIGEHAFSLTDMTAVTVPHSVDSIGEWAFYRCRLTSVKITAGVKSIGRNAFANCNGLTSVTVPGSVKSIGQMAFMECVNLKSVTIEDGAETIGDMAFKNSGLETVTIPNSVTFIGKDVFSQCKRLASVILKNPAPLNVGEYTFRNAYPGCLYVPKNSIAAYRSAGYWNRFECYKDIAEAPRGR